MRAGSAFLPPEGFKKGDGFLLGIELRKELKFTDRCL